LNHIPFDTDTAVLITVCSSLEYVFGGVKTSYILKIWNSQVSESADNAPIEKNRMTTWQMKECAPALNIDPKIHESQVVVGRVVTQSVDRWGCERWRGAQWAGPFQLR
jgi:hypothetical protein